MPSAPPRPGLFRTLLSFAALAVLLALGVRFAGQYVSTPTLPRPHDFLQVWCAGQLVQSGGNPYDGVAMFNLQVANRMPDSRTAAFPDGYASMMWVPPWGLTVAAALAVLPVDAAQMVWVYGQLALIAAAAAWVWLTYGGNPRRWWVGVALALGSGPVWWQTTGGQYAGLLFVGMAGYLAAHRANRPVLAGLSLTLVALKPHLLLPLAIGMLIDGVRTPFGRRVLLGGMLGLGLAAAAATALNPSVWGWYLAAARSVGPGAEWYPKLSDWFNPTVGAWVRHALPGHPFWVQFVPGVVATVLFTGYWLRRGGPDRWPAVLPWVIPVGLMTAPYGSWTSDLTLLLVPTIWVAIRLDAAGWPARAWPALAVYAAANAAVVILTAIRTDVQDYVWVAPLVAVCLLSALRATRPAPATSRAEPALTPALSAT